MIELKVRKIGNSLGVILPADAASALNVTSGDKLYLTEMPDGLRLTSFDPAFKRKMQAAKEGMRRYRNALRELAK